MSAAGWTQLEERANRGDREAQAALIILGEPWARGKAAPFITTDGIDFAGMLGHCTEETHPKQPEPFTAAWDRWEPCVCVTGAPYWSSGERLMVSLAANLWNSSNAWFNLARLLETCGDQWLAIAARAIAARNGGQPLPAVTEVWS